ncbi:MAG: helix-turn-helix domain-containing protein [Eisenbergiella sp.]
MTEPICTSFLTGSWESLPAISVKLRLSMAKRLLSSTDLRITEISNSCGFADSASFCHHFQARFSITPTQFRKEPGREPVP